MTKIKYDTVDIAEAGNDWSNKFDLARKGDETIKDYPYNSEEFTFYYMTFNTLFYHNKPIFVFEIDRSTAQWEVKKVTILGCNKSEIDVTSHFTYNLTVTQDNINLVYTNIPTINKEIEQNDIDSAQFKTKDNLYSYQTKEEIEEALNEDGFIVFRNALNFFKGYDNKIYLNDGMHTDIQLTYISLLENNLDTKYWSACPTVLIDHNIKELYPERFI